MTDLLSLQRALHSALRGKATVPPTLAANAERGLNVHRTTIESGLAQTITATFPTLRRVVGVPAFSALAKDFVAENPPGHPVLFAYGAAFPAFIASHGVGKDLPYLADLGRVEWARHEAYLADDAPVLDAAALDTNDADAIGRLRFRFHPATRLVSSAFPVYRIWRVNQPDVADVPPVDMTIGEHVIVTRPQTTVITRGMTAGDAAMMHALKDGADLGAAVEAASAAETAFDVTAALAGHFANGSFRAGTERNAAPVSL